MHDDILIATDGSEGMEGVIGEAFDFAELCDATVHGYRAVRLRRRRRPRRSVVGTRYQGRR